MGGSYGSSAIINDKTDSEICISLTFSSICQYRIDATHHPILQYWKEGKKRDIYSPIYTHL